MPGSVTSMTTLSEAERARIAAAIAAAERGTAGEIVVMVAARSGAYRSLPPPWRSRAPSRCPGR